VSRNTKTFSWARAAVTANWEIAEDPPVTAGLERTIEGERGAGPDIWPQGRAETKLLPRPRLAGTAGGNDFDPLDGI